VEESLDAIDKTAGIDDYKVCILIGRGSFIAFGTQLGKDLLGVHQGFRATEGDKADTGSLLFQRCHLICNIAFLKGKSE
jgi:hypothetical protein